LRLAAVAVAALLPVSASAGQKLLYSASKDKPLYKEGEVIVKFRRSTTRTLMSAAASAVHSQAGIVKTMAALGRPTTALVRAQKGAGMSVPEMVAAFRARPDVEYAEPNYMAYIPDLYVSDKPDTTEVYPGEDGIPTPDASKWADPVKVALLQAQRKAVGDVTASAISAAPNDWYTGYQGGWSFMGGYVIWPDKVANPMVAVIDTGVDYLHPDLAGRVVKGFDYINGDADPMDDNGHGTHCAGNVGALTSNGKGVSGLSTAMILAIKVLDETGAGSYFDIAAGITSAALNPGVKILSLSLGGGSDSVTLQNAVKTAVDKGKLVVVAAGNSNNTLPSYPAFYADASDPLTGARNSQVVAVAAAGSISYYGTCPGAYPGCYSALNYYCRANYSNYGSWVSVEAPGTSILSTTPTTPFYLGWYYGVYSYYAYLDGTSMATPLVAAAAARAFSAMPAGTTAAQVKARLVATGGADVANAHFYGSTLDLDGNGAADRACWEAATPNTVTATHAAAAMQRTEAEGYALDANGGIPLFGLTVPAYIGAAAKGVVTSGGGGYVWYTLNIPMSSTPYDLKVNKTGYTLGPQKFTSLVMDTTCGTPPPGVTASVRDCTVRVPNDVSVTIPKNVSGRIHVVTDWGGGYTGPELDSYLFTPSLSALPCSIGYSGSCGSGELAIAPFARWIHDGGTFTGTWRQEELQLRMPLAPTPAGSTPYGIFIDDYVNGANIRNTGAYGMHTKTRIWMGGVIKATVDATTADITTKNCTLGGGANACDVWYVGDISGTGVFTPKNIFGIGGNLAAPPAGSLFPYSFVQGVGGGADKGVGQTPLPGGKGGSN
jgi:subtilisin family serine protease